MLSRDGTESLTAKLYRLLHSQPAATDDDLRRALYGAGVADNHQPYRSLKTRLRHILVQAISADLDIPPRYTTYDLAYQNGFRQLNLARVLMHAGAITAARDIAASTYQAIKKYEIIILNEGLTDVLAALYLSILYNDKLLRQYNEEHQYYARATYDVNRVKFAFRTVRNLQNTNRLPPLELGSTALRYVEELSEIRDRYPRVSQVQVTIATLEIMGYNFRGDHHQVMTAAQRARDALANCAGASTNSMSVMALTSVEATVRMRNFALGKQQITAARAVVPTRGINSIKLSEYAIRLGLITGQYQYAYASLAEVDFDSLRQHLLDIHRERWQLLEAYVHLLVQAGRVGVEPERPLRPFRLARLLNNVPTYSRQKRGANIELLILQASFFIVRREYDRVQDRIEALERYCNRYLRSEETLRNNGFLRLLLVAAAVNFNRAAAERRAAPILQRMREHLEKPRTGLAPEEYIPYEELWSVLLDHLTNRKYAARRKKSQ